MSNDITRDLWLLPGELPGVLERLGVKVSGESFLKKRDVAGDAPTVRDIDRILAELPPGKRETLALALGNLCRRKQALHVLRRRRARPSIEVFAVPCEDDAEGQQILDVLWIEDSANIEFCHGIDRAHFIAWLYEPYVQLVEPDIALRDMNPLALSELQVVLALGDLFRTRYPDPDPAWVPDGLIRFEAEEVIALLRAGWEGNDPHSLVSEYAALTSIAWPRLTPDQVRQLLSVLALFEWIGIGGDKLDDDSSEDAQRSLPPYWMTRDLTWFVRCLGWWNNSLRMDLAGETQQHAGALPALTLIQATWPWVFEESEGGTSLRIRIAPVSPGSVRGSLDESVNQLLDAVVTSPSDQPASEPAATSQAKPEGADSVCGSCGAAVLAGARFCPRCGQALAPAQPAAPVQPVCPSCSSPVQPIAKFCARCGCKLMKS